MEGLESREDILAAEEPAKERGSASVSAVLSPSYSFSMEQNGFGFVQRADIRNDGEEALLDLRIRIGVQPRLFDPFVRELTGVGAGESLRVDDIALVPDAEEFLSLTEKITGTVSVFLERREQGPEGTCWAQLACAKYTADILPYDQWCGFGLYPELLASFVTPNHPGLVPILSRASALLREWTGDPSFDGYFAADPGRVLKQLAAVYAAIGQEGIVYAVAPASFEQSGQRVRLVDQILENRSANCLEVSLLCASLLEAAGLHPILLLTENHCFAGVWLEDFTFPDAVGDDPSLVAKRIAAGVSEMAVAEMTAALSGKGISFDEARAAAEKRLFAPEPGEQVLGILDIRRARLDGVRPLPVRVYAGERYRLVPEKKEEAEVPGGVSAPGEVVKTSFEERTEVLTRKGVWERKLLDLGLRNSLISMRLSRMSVPLHIASLDALEDRLAKGDTFAILPRPEAFGDRRAAGEGETEAQALFEGLTAHRDHPLLEQEFSAKRLRSDLTESSLESALKALYRQGKASIEETGVNTVYLALGFLKWLESPKSRKPRYAPLILLPAELIRSASRGACSLRLRDEEPMMNVTLLEKLRQDFGIDIGGLDPLPEDGDGIDTRAVFTILRRALMDRKGWDVVEGAMLGSFSFAQYVMWNDIRNRSGALSASPVVKSLLEGKLAFPAREMDPSGVEEEDVLLPLPADASQLYAIREACAGRSFVLHGPPGTGKSQTITAMIANALSQGRTVLFVSEKMAALSVVQKRLEDIGIGPFCLELHSNRSRKKDLLEQLERAADARGDFSCEDYEARARDLRALRSASSGYARALSEKQLCGLNVYQIISRYEENRDAPELAGFVGSGAASLTQGELRERERVLEELADALGRTGGIPGHPLQSISRSSYEPGLAGRARDLLLEYRDAAGRMEAALLPLEEALGFTAARLEDIGKALGLAGPLEVLAEAALPGSALEAPEKLLEGISRMREAAEAAEEAERDVYTVFDGDVSQLDEADLLQRLKASEAKWALPRTLGRMAVARELKPYAKAPVPAGDLHRVLALLVENRAKRGAAGEAFARYGALCGDAFRSWDTDWEGLSREGEAARSVKKLLGRLPEPGALGALRAFEGAWERFEQARTRLDDCLQLTGREAADAHGQRALAEKLLAGAEGLREWIHCNRCAEEARKLGLAPVVRAAEEGMEAGQLLPAYRKALCRALAQSCIAASPELATFSGTAFDEVVRKFREMDAAQMLLAREEIFARLAAGIPSFTREAASSSEVGILQRFLRSGGRGVSIRRLFEQLPTLLPKLLPCMLMSPLSAAQYLSTNREPFDIVVFDEASQLTTPKAVGALARGRSAVIVGDPNQMPPTSFFMTNTFDEENPEVEDLESILDEALALSMPQTHLLWHYRSRHESLIAFSNAQFYDNRLLTFPSADDAERRVTLVPVPDGHFERGRGRVNRREAEAIVEELLRRFADPRHSRESIGVVTFNIQQQNLIDDLFAEKCREVEGLEAWANGPEPLFIKNLENVQGDERDVILFSVAFGPDEDGRVSMNFGPLNRAGGWRRLNVAVSRAKREMKIFATLRPDQIDESRAGAQGVRALKAFLAYAAGEDLPRRSPGASVSGYPGIREAIAGALEEAGYRVRRCIGHSSFYVDLGVADPKNENRCLLGILLDSEAYQGALTARDREIGQPSVLEGLGWNLHRVWTMDWWDDPGREVRRILERLRALEEAEEKEIPAPALLETRSVPAAGREAIPAEAPDLPVYVPVSLPAESISAEAFLSYPYAERIRERILLTAEKEGPVSEALLTKRVLASFGIARAGSKMKSRVYLLAQMLSLPMTVEDGVRFIWNAGQDPAAYRGLRTGAGTEKRDAKDLPGAEMINALCVVLHEQFSLPAEDLIREGAKRMGYARMGAGLSAAFGGALERCLAEGLASEGARGIVLTQEGEKRSLEVLEAVRAACTETRES